MGQPLRLLIVHDSAGRIHLLVASDPDAPWASPALNVGEQLSVVEGHGLSFDLSDAELQDQMNRIAADFTVQQPQVADAPSSATLKPK
jgi:hypothetical protein